MLEVIKARMGSASSLHFYGSVVALFSLKGHKDGAWRCYAFEFIFLKKVDLLIYLSHLIPRLFTDSLASFAQQTDNLLILEGEGRHCYLGAVFWYNFIAQVRQL